MLQPRNPCQHALIYIKATIHIVLQAVSTDMYMYLLFHATFFFLQGTVILQWDIYVNKNEEH